MPFHQSRLPPQERLGYRLCVSIRSSDLEVGGGIYAVAGASKPQASSVIIEAAYELNINRLRRNYQNYVHLVTGLSCPSFRGLD